MPRKSRAELAVVPRLADHHRRITAPPGMFAGRRQSYFERLSRPRQRCISLNPMRRFCEAIAKPSSLANWRFHPRNKARARWAIGRNAVGRSQCYPSS